MYIAFEGGEGSGKGTQIKLLKKHLYSQKYNVMSIIEPGGTPTGKEIRKILLNKKELDILGITEVFLFSASRAQQVRTVIRPALDENVIVISDRSFYSTFAYQGFGRVTNLDLLKNLTNIAVENTVPDLVILLDLPPEVGLVRKKIQNKMNRLDEEHIYFHRRVREGYLHFAKQEKHKWKVIDATESKVSISKKVNEFVMQHLNS